MLPQYNDAYVIMLTNDVTCNIARFQPKYVVDASIKII